MGISRHVPYDDTGRCNIGPSDLSDGPDKFRSFKISPITRSL